MKHAPTLNTDTTTTSSADLLIWWSTLEDDEQELLRVTFSRIPDDDHMVAFLAHTDCPLVRPTGDEDKPYRITQTKQLHTLLSQI